MRQLSIVLLILTLTSCSFYTKIKEAPRAITNRDKHYLEAKTIPPLRLPPGLTSDQFESDYPVSDRPYPEAAKQVDVTPPDFETH